MEKIPAMIVALFLISVLTVVICTFRDCVDQHKKFVAAMAAAAALNAQQAKAASPPIYDGTYDAVVVDKMIHRDDGSDHFIIVLQFSDGVCNEYEFNITSYYRMTVGEKGTWTLKNNVGDFEPVK